MQTFYDGISLFVLLICFWNWHLQIYEKKAGLLDRTYFMGLVKKLDAYVSFLMQNNM